MSPCRAALAALLAAGSALPVAAHAQDEAGGINAHGFTLVAQDGDPRDALALHRPGQLHAGEWFATGVLEYARQPLVLVTESSEGTVETRDALDHVLAANLVGGVAVLDRVRLTASLPVFATTTGLDGTRGPALGDLRLDAMLLVVDPDSHQGLGAGLVPWIDLPTGARRRFLGRRTVAGGFAAAGTWELDRFTLTGNLGFQFDPKVDVSNLTGADAFTTGFAVNWLVADRSALTLESRLHAPLARNDRAGTGAPAEVILHGRHRFEGGGHVLGGVGLPLSAGAGAAAFRLFLGGGFGRVGPGAPKDSDLDGLTDDLDACPDQPETENGYIDEDGCPDALSVLEARVTWRGEPVDDATLSISGPEGDAESLTPEGGIWTREVPPDTLWKLEARRGECLRGETKQLVGEGRVVAEVPLELVPSATLSVTVMDTSGNPVPGARILFDSETPECLPDAPELDRTGRGEVDIGPGAFTVVAGAPDYRVVEVPVVAGVGDDIPVEIVLKPTKLRVEKKRIVILEKVRFAFNRAVIQEQSYELLDEVAEVIRRNPDAGRVAVRGHTDSKGSERYNQDLSQRRAEAVREYLIEKGVDADRLMAEGYGESQPVADNATEAGRARNRRVEFLLVDQGENRIEEPVPEGADPTTEPAEDGSGPGDAPPR